MNGVTNEVTEWQTVKISLLQHLKSLAMQAQVIFANNVSSRQKAVITEGRMRDNRLLCRNRWITPRMWIRQASSAGRGIHTRILRTRVCIAGCSWRVEVHRVIRYSAKRRRLSIRSSRVYLMRLAYRSINRSVNDRSSGCLARSAAPNFDYDSRRESAETYIVNIKRVHFIRAILFWLYNEQNLICVIGSRENNPRAICTVKNLSKNSDNN